MNYGIQIDSNNIIIGTLSTSEPLPSGWIAITAAQLPSAQVAGATWDASTSTVNPPASNYNLNAVATSQIQLVTAQAMAALSSPVTFTNAAGTTASFANTKENHDNLGGALESWNSTTWPSTFFIYDTSNVPVILTYADAEGLAAAFANATLAVYTKLNSLIAQIDGYVTSGGTVTEIQAVTYA